ncbi:MAG: 3-deoxy-7-phosphoheptulonate synthase [Sphingomonadales bacterium]
MILQLEQNASHEQIASLISRLDAMGLKAVMNRTGGHTNLAIIRGVDKNTRPDLFKHLPLVKSVTAFSDKFKLTSRDFQQEKTIIEMGDVAIGDGSLLVMAGPCAIESREQIWGIAEAVANRGASVLRGGAFKPRTSPYDFQGLGEEGLIYMRDAAREFGLLAISEVMSPEDVPLVSKYMDILQIGARNMQNFALLRATGSSDKPVLLKRGLSATYMEFILAAEYTVSCGNPNVMLCERGIRTFETFTRNTLDLTAVPVLQEMTHLPIVVDPSHGTGLRHLIAPMSKAAMVVGADGIIVEVHTNPDAAVSDAQQTISPQVFGEMMVDLRRIGQAIGTPLREVQV